MRYRIRDVLLVSSLYDSFILEEDGHLYEMILSGYHEFNLSQAPRLTRASSGRQAIEMVNGRGHFDLIVTTLNLGDMQALELAKEIRKIRPDLPMVLLTYENRELNELIKNYDVSDFDKVFIWQGDHRILLSIIKYVEDKMNVESDTNSVGVQSIIVIEDNVNFYSSFLPIIYSELFRHSQSLIAEGINVADKLMRMRARPKILLCSTYEEALDYYEKYEEYILGVISDIEFPRNGRNDREAGLRFARKVRESHFDIPVLLQTDSAKYDEVADELGASILLKTSPTLLRDLQRFMVESLSFGDFVFRLPDGEEVARASDIRSLEKALELVPEESLEFHAEKNHFSNWLKTRTEFWLAHKLRPRKVSEFESLESVRQHLINSLREFRKERHLGTISDFDPETFYTSSNFARIGRGSLGGKARGLAFANSIINDFKLSDFFEDIAITVPPSLVLATDIFDRFLEINDLKDFAIKCRDDDELKNVFLAADFPPEVVNGLMSFLNLIHNPLAVRSSSLLEDSRYLPFAGIYSTYMLPNNNINDSIRLKNLLDAIKLVYASTYGQLAKGYIRATPYRLEEEKMGILIQKLVGAKYGDRFYPNFSGVVRSHNFYPTAPMKASDGIAAVGLGLGRIVIEGEATVRFCPKFPRHVIQFSDVKDALDYSQKEFYALDLNDSVSDPADYEELKLVKYGLDTAEKDGTLTFVGSTYSVENNVITDGLSRSGPRVVTFAPILKNRLFPLPEILGMIMEMGSWGMNSPVEIEFAVNLNTAKGKPQEFAFLQIRPLVKSHEADELNVDDVEEENLICQSPQVLGNGLIDDIYDVIVVDRDRFDRSKSAEVADEVAKYNLDLLSKEIPYILIGVGRWGSGDPWLGIPVTWDQISGARVIVETGFKGFKVVPSQGSHFFQNITSFMVGYFTINSYFKGGFLDWEWLADQQAVSKMQFTRHLRFKNPVIVKMNGHNHRGIIIKPDR
ncbi:MAG: histidine kinase [candidate division Zixibacteria bacterium]|nr:histidine kinase [candidate division Zixibacteria bacterium]NIT51618.1 histidine kinase [candidate division Zixibacteria bacterium]NIU07982.1 histidine kinase [Phycisphaerae bacterium]NIW39490.1 histidine kinase [candidate division Zixibacteria bacterium]